MMPDCADTYALRVLPPFRSARLLCSYLPIVTRRYFENQTLIGKLHDKAKEDAAAITELRDKVAQLEDAADPSKPVTDR
jgi:hypothetical protein